MYTQFVEDGRVIWFACSLNDPKNSEIMRHQKVNVVYSDPAKHTYVSISGRATVEADKSAIRKLLRQHDSLEGRHSWFPKDADNDHLAIIRVEVELAEYWDADSGVMQDIRSYLDSKISGKVDEPASDTHEKIQFVSV